MLARAGRIMEPWFTALAPRPQRSLPVGPQLSANEGGARPDTFGGHAQARSRIRFECESPPEVAPSVAGQFMRHRSWRHQLANTGVRLWRSRASPNVGSERARSEYAELVALRVPKNDPGLLALSHVRSCGSQREQSLDLGVSVVWSEVEVQAILRRLRLETDTKRSPGSRSAVDLISNSSGSSFTTTQPSASRHQSPRALGSRASTIVCSHSRLMSRS